MQKVSPQQCNGWGSNSCLRRCSIVATDPTCGSCNDHDKQHCVGSTGSNNVVDSPFSERIHWTWVVDRKTCILVFRVWNLWFVLCVLLKIFCKLPQPGVYVEQRGKLCPVNLSYYTSIFLYFYSVIDIPLTAISPDGKWRCGRGWSTSFSQASEPVKV